MSRPAGTNGSTATATTHRRVGFAMAALAALLTIATLGGPGLTVDEPLDVRPGRDYFATLQRTGWRFFERANVDRAFRDNAEHPPLGRWLLGLASLIGEPFEPLWNGYDPTGVHVASGRLAPALAFAVLVGLIAAEAARRWGNPSGLAAGWALLVKPRVFSHAHLAALDTFLSLFWTLALLAGARAVEARRVTPAMAAAGALWALALLTKIHAWLLAPLLLAWAFSRLSPSRAIKAMAVWTAAGVALFVAGWPWLWYDTVTRWAAYWGTSVARATIRVEYFGRIWNDRDVPWHYPWLYFAVTVPVVLHAAGAVGVVRAWHARRGDRFPFLLIASILLFLTLFSTGVPVYDGERLFLHVFPAWAMLIGYGCGLAWTTLRGSRAGRIAVLGVLLCQSYGAISMHPFGLSYYNLLVGGLPGAERLGLELTYWGDAVDRVLLDDLARRADKGSVAALAPTLYPGQGVLTTTAALARRDVILQDESAVPRADWIVVHRRLAYWSPELTQALATVNERDLWITRRSRHGVWLSALWHIPRTLAPGPKNDAKPSSP
ncbi:MAG: glycosyltransferase family 39 protein [Paludisphaera borealis]|uniref:ArnT family glycosyltransferase n=1 Tax=Paludisphaera borealis TaxID=1387353 RepID=UPI00283AB936|nr:glycosyltransferase family 39 protein [Paludisphaera borealis]MDR3622825.1 glycosyltransferase family 39 protein [Paludisphaera borealis]